MKKLFFFLAPLLGGLSTCAAVQVSFTGGNGTPLSMTLGSPANYSVTTTAANAPFFVFDGLGDSFVPAGITVSGTITYSINGGAAQTINRLGSGRAANDVTADDAYLFSAALPGVTAGTTIRLLSGTLTTTANFTGAPPAGGNFPSFIAAQNGNQVSGLATAVPEPGTAALVLVAGGGAAWVAFRRRQPK